MQKNPFNYAVFLIPLYNGCSLVGALGASLVDFFRYYSSWVQQQTCLFIDDISIVNQESFELRP